MSHQPHSTTASLDVFILTFNAAKEQIDASVFALHLRNAFAKNASTLPDIVVVSLQEMAPLEHSFIGSYLINPYFRSWVTAINLAASPPVGRLGRDQPFYHDEQGYRDEYQDGFQDASRNQQEPRDSPYALVATRNVGMTGILLFARDPGALDNLKSAEVGFGAGDMANKGAVGLRVLFSKHDAEGRKRQTELTFVATHLAAHEWNLERRNKNWESIVSGLLFEDPQKLRGGESTYPTPRISNSDDEHEVLLSRDANEKALHDITIYKPGSHLFVAGDLNYRISQTAPTNKSVFPHMDPDSPNYFEQFLALDQLVLEKAAGRTLHGLTEPPVLFPPTYKLQLLGGKEAQAAQAHQAGFPPAHDVVFWKWAPHRWPGWCDRVLYLDIPPWLSQSSTGPATVIDTLAYDALPPVRTSDHRAVFLRLVVPIIEPSVLAPSPESSALNSNDPRVKLPYPVDLEAWDHRARVKKWEWVIGWSMLVSRSKHCIAIFTTLFLIGLGVGWLRSR